MLLLFDLLVLCEPKHGKQLISSTFAKLVLSNTNKVKNNTTRLFFQFFSFFSFLKKKLKRITSMDKTV